jgi:hypothetical protein
MITWKEDTYSRFNGAAGGIHLFAIRWHTRTGWMGWVMQTDLPGLTWKRWTSDDREELYRQAEKVLAGWLARVADPPALGPRSSPGTARLRPFHCFLHRSVYSTADTADTIASTPSTSRPEPPRGTRKLATTNGGAISQSDTATHPNRRARNAQTPANTPTKTGTDSRISTHPLTTGSSPPATTTQARSPTQNLPLRLLRKLT